MLERKTNIISLLCSPPVLKPIHTMSAIDYMQLLREEKRKRKSKVQQGGQNDNDTDLTETTKQQQQEQQSMTITTTTTRPATHTPQDRLPSWTCPPGQLGFRRLDLRVVCQRPSTISYSSGVVDDTTELQGWMARLPEGDTGLNSWKTMTYGKRRAAMFGEKNGEALPPPLDELANELVACGIFPVAEPPNHVLCNDYRPSQGILPHTDGPLYSSRTATLSLGSDVVMSFTKRLSSEQIGTTANNSSVDVDVDDDQQQQQQQQQPLQILLESGSLLTFEGDAYINYCHGIEMNVMQDETSEHCLNASPHRIVPRGRRFSLTFRHKPPPAAAAASVVAQDG
jgi:alkylated DNA repair dioxygenase AlkB